MIGIQNKIIYNKYYSPVADLNYTLENSKYVMVHMILISSQSLIV
jgi:hypothetical protein